MIWKEAVYDMKQKQERIKRYPLLAKNRDDVISLIILDFIGDTMNKTLFYIIIIWQEENRSPRISLRTDALASKKEKKSGMEASVHRLPRTNLSLWFNGSIKHDSFTCYLRLN